jgi:hypothetical protein
MERGVPKPLSPYDTCAEREAPPGVWYRALALAATFPDVLLSAAPFQTQLGAV